MGVLNRRNNGSKKEDNDNVSPFTVIKGNFHKQKGKEEKETPKTLEEWREQELKEYKVKITNEKLKNLPWEKVAQAIIDCDGYVMKTAIKLGCSYWKLAKIIKENPKLKSLIKDANEALLDISETKLRDLILSGDKVAIIFHLKSKGRHRGWVEDGPVLSEDEQPVQFVYETVLPAGYKLVPMDEPIKKEVGNIEVKGEIVQQAENG